ncbi:MAG: hypothetical protein JSW64_13315 [Candidatus Zixiibacteriota bacterium]|nr:MAG: hypothetical protein JSW64_13315 [candidate division Zixibacteria bacterium]
MRRFFAVIIILSVSLSCKDQPVVSNLTRPGGYAMGDSVSLAFSVSGMNTAPDSLQVKIFEKKTGYLYDIFAGRADLSDKDRFECFWDGRKPDGSWPAGGRYWVYAIIPESNVISDTVEIGLTD